MMTNRAVFFPVVAALVVAARVMTAAAILAPGQPAPTLTLKAPDGRPLSLAAMKGHPVLVDFWASWCPPCRTSVPALEDLYREFHARGLDVVAINVDERRKDADAFLAGRQYTMPIIFDTGGRARVMPACTACRRRSWLAVTARFGSCIADILTRCSELYRHEIELLLAEEQPRESK